MPLSPALLTGRCGGVVAAGDGQWPRHRAAEFLLEGRFGRACRSAVVSFVAKAIVTLLTIRSGALRWRCCSRASHWALPEVRFWAFFGCRCSTRIRSACMRCWVACALLAASQQAPLMAICLVMELADAPINLFVPIGLCGGRQRVHRLPSGQSRCRLHLPPGEKLQIVQPSHCRLAHPHADAILTWPSGRSVRKQHGEHRTSGRRCGSSPRRRTAARCAESTSRRNRAGAGRRASWCADCLPHLSSAAKS